MLRRKKVETINFKDFMDGSYKQTIQPRVTKEMIIKAGVMITTLTLSLTFGDLSLVSAGAVNGVITDKVITAFDPMIQLAQALSYPIGMVMMLGGGLFMMIGNSDKGLSMIQKAGMGYILVQMLPMFMDLLVEIAKSL